jgi:hypothetical protein
MKLDKQAEGQVERQAGGWTGRHMYRHAAGHSGRSDIWKGRQTDRQEARQWTGRQLKMKAQKETDGQAALKCRKLDKVDAHCSSH